MNSDDTPDRQGAVPAWAARLLQDLTQLREDIAQRGLEPDAPTRWAWDPWPDLCNAGHYRGQAAGLGTPCPFLNTASPVRLLEAHAFWVSGSNEQHLLILPQGKDGGLHGRWRSAAVPEFDRTAT